MFIEIQKSNCIVLLLFMLWPIFVCGSTEAPANRCGFVNVFNGKDLIGWDGDPRYWSVKDGVIRGQGTKEDYSKCNTFLIRQGPNVTDFILKLKFKMHYGNSGVQYRSRQVSDENSKWRVFGYQSEVADMTYINGFLFDENPRGVLAHVGEFVVTDKQGKKYVVGQIGDAKKLGEIKFSKNNEWNELTIIARGNHLIHIINGYQTIEFIDNDSNLRMSEGIIALQLHGGGPGIVEYKDIYLKQLKPKYGDAIMLFDSYSFKGWQFYPDNVEDAWSIRDAGIPQETEQIIKVYNRKPGEVNFINSVIVNKGKPQGYIRTVVDYTNYVLRFQFRHITKGNGGVLLRMVGKDEVWPRSIEVQGQFGSVGDIWNIGVFPMKVDTDRTQGRCTSKMKSSNEKPLGQWNQCEVTLDGGDFEIKVNGVIQNKAEKCWETPGKICIQSEGGQIEYRNFVLIPVISDKK